MNRLEDVLMGVKRLREVKESMETVGAYDIVAKIESDSGNILIGFF